MLAPLEALTQLQARAAEFAGQIPWHRARGLASLIMELPTAPSGIPDLAGPLFHLEHAHRRELRAGFGAALQYRANTPQGLQRARQRARAILPHWWRLDLDDTGFDVFAWFGFGADAGAVGLPGSRAPALLWVPELALQCRDGQCGLILTTGLPADQGRVTRRWQALLQRLVPALAVPAPGPLTPARLHRGASLPDRAGWRQLVAEALEAIADGQFHKVVAVRRLRLTGERRLDPARLAAALGYLFPTCQVLRWQLDRSTCIAATPERLLSLRGRQVTVDALAGTAARAADPAQDAGLAADLLSSRKDRHEHALVVEELVRALSPLSATLQVPAQPQLLQLNNAQHLWSPIRATLAADEDMLGLAARLHPTPAVNGAPRAAARRWLRQREHFDRGWYTGAAGWIGPDLGGELWVLLRYARIEGNAADLYAGAGLVSGSDPDSEWRETEHKLGAMLTALQFA